MFVEKDVRQFLHEIETENLRLKTENSALAATLNMERERFIARESKIIRYETELDQLNRKLRDKEEYISKVEHNLGEKQTQLIQKEQEKEKQRRKFNSKIALEHDKKNREMEQKLTEQKRTMQDQMRSQEEKLRMVTDIVNGNDSCVGQPVSNLIRRFNSNCENAVPPGSERKPRPRVN